MDRGSHGGGGLAAIPANALASMLLALADGLILHPALDRGGIPLAQRSPRDRPDASRRAIARPVISSATGFPAPRRVGSITAASGSQVGQQRLGSRVRLVAWSWAPGAGLGAIAFRYMILGVTRLFTGIATTAPPGHTANPHLAGLGMWYVVLAPIVGGLIYGPLVVTLRSRGARARRARGDARGRPAAAAGSARRSRSSSRWPRRCASGRAGRSGARGRSCRSARRSGSALGQLAKVPETRLRILVACGAAGGISATFNAPIAGVFFALELILQDFEPRVVRRGRAGLGRRQRDGPCGLRLAGVPQPPRLPSRVGLGVRPVRAARRRRGVVGVGFIRVLYGAEDLADRLWRGPEWLRPAVGGVLLGLLLLALAADVRGRLPGARSRGRRQYVVGLLLGAAGRQDGRDKPDDRDRRVRWSVRAVAVHGGDARLRLRRRRARPASRGRRRGGRVWASWNGRGVRGYCPRTDHRA